MAKTHVSATVQNVLNENPDGNECKNYTIIRCSMFHIQLTPDEIEAGQKRFNAKPHVKKKPAKKPAKKTSSGDK